MLKVIDSAVPVACWSCSVAHNTSTLFCPHCSKIQPPATGDYFSVFSLEPKLNIDTAVLEHEFHRLSRKLHPDRYARATDSERQFALADTALLNDAYRTLKDPLRRTEYLLKLMGGEIGDDSPAGEKLRKDASRAPADLLEEVFELNMQLEEMRSAHQAGEDNAELVSDLITAKKKFEGLMEAVDAELREQWNDWEAGDTTRRKIAQKHMIALLDRRRYLSNLVREVSDTLAA